MTISQYISQLNKYYKTGISSTNQTDITAKQETNGRGQAQETPVGEDTAGMDAGTPTQFAGERISGRDVEGKGTPRSKGRLGDARDDAGTRSAGTVGQGDSPGRTGTNGLRTVKR